MAPIQGARRWVYRAGGISAILLGAGYVVIIGLFVPIGAPPTGSEARLAHVAAHAGSWWAILALSVLTDVLFVPVAFSLYVALEEVDRYAMAIASVCVALFVVLDLAVTWTNYAALIGLSTKYATAATEAQRLAAITAAEYPSAVLDSTLLFVYNTLTLAVGILLTGLVMRKGNFSKSAAYLGLATGILGVVSVAGSLVIRGLSFAIILTSVLTTIWLLIAGVRLHRLGR